MLTSFSQSSVRKIAVGDEAEIVFTRLPGQTFSGRVVRIVGMSGEAQLSASSQLPSLSGGPVTGRFAVLVELDDREVVGRLPQGSGGAVAVYTSAGKPVHIISRVALRINAWLGYLTAP